MVCELLTAAEKYCIEDLKILCEETMIDNLDTENAIDYLVSADFNNSKIAQKIIKKITFMKNNIKEAVEYKSLQISYPHLAKLFVKQ